MENKEAGTPPPIPSREGRLQPTLLLATLSAAFGSAFQYGYNLSVVNTPHKVFKSFYNETYFERHATFMDGKLMLLLWSCTVSMFPLGGLLGSLVVGLLVDSCGRKGTLLINNIFAIVPAILMGVSKVAKAFELIIFSRVVLGVCAGISYSALPMYLGELAPKNLRGLLGTMTEVFVIIGVFLAQIFSLQVILGNPEGWPVLLALTGVPALLQLLTLPFFPESPRYSLIQKGDEAAARQALRRLRGHMDLEAEVEDMRAEAQAERAEGHLSVLRLCALQSLRWQLLSIIVLMAGQQLSGINAINYYADTIYASAGVEAAYSQYVTVGSGVVNIVMTLTSAVLVERLGRRRLLLAGYGICGSACLVLTVVLLFQNKLSELSYLGIICVFAYIAGHSIGPSPVPSVVRTEIFLQSSRRAAFMVDGAVHWLTNFIVGFLFPSIQGPTSEKGSLCQCSWMAGLQGWNPGVSGTHSGDWSPESKACRQEAEPRQADRTSDAALWILGSGCTGSQASPGFFRCNQVKNFEMKFWIIQKDPKSNDK
ncbi:solute carrier family 2, facilitated glucose transporter member 7 isoform X2 [Macaca mulatta]